MKPLYEYPQTPMSTEQTQMLMGLYLLPADAIKQAIADVSNEFLYKVIRKRLDVLALNVDDRVILLILGTLAESTPGAVAMYVHALFHMKLKNNPPVIDLDEFVKFFHSGFPSKRVLSEAWDAQKRSDGNNEVDVQETYA